MKRLFAVATNGFVLGVVYRFASRGFGYVKAAKMELPHGVLEIPAVVIAASYGLWLGVTFARILRQKSLAGFEKDVFLRSGCPSRL